MLAQKLILSYSSRIFIHIIQMVVGIIVARIVGPGVIGAIAFALAYISMFSFISDLGLSTAHIKLINDSENQADCIATFTYLKIGLIILFASVVLLVFIFQRVILGYSFERPEYDILIIITLLTSIFGEIYKIPQSTFIARVEQAKVDLPEILNNILHQILRIIVVYAGYKAIALVISRLVSTLIVLPIYFYLFKNYPFGKFNKELVKKYISFSFPLIVILFSQSIIYWSDKVILQFFTNINEVGYYAASYGFTNFITLIQTSIGTIFFPTFVKNLNEKNYDSINNRLKRYERFNFIYIYPFIVLLSTFSDIIIPTLLGKKYLETIPIFSVIIFAFFIPLINLPYGNIILGKGYLNLSAKIFFSVLLFFVLIAMFMVSKSFMNLGGLGMALTLLIANFLLGLLFVFFTKKKVPEVKILQSKNIIYFALIHFIIFYFSYNHLEYSLEKYLLLTPTYFISYWGGLILMKLINKEDLYFLKEIINFRKLKNYIKDEITNSEKK